MSHYLDHAASTPVRPEVVAAVAEELARTGNPSSTHEAGRGVRRIVEEARESLAAALGADPAEVLLTSGGTEADNLAVLGAHRARVAANPRRNRLVVSAVEHHAVLDAVEHLVDTEGARVTWIEPDSAGFVTPAAVRAALGDDPGDVSLVSVLWAGNEVGVVNDLTGIAAVAHEFGVPVHSDAVAAFGHVPVDVHAAGVDLVSVTGHKLGGPVGTGALVVRRGLDLVPTTFGGGQERRLRSGTLNAAGARGFALAASLACAEIDAEATRLLALRDSLLDGILALGLDADVTGHWERGDGVRRVPGNAHVTVPGCDRDALFFLLDAGGIAASAGSACTSGVVRASHVVLAMGIDEPRADGAIRFSLGRTSTPEDVEAVLAALPDAVAGARRALEVAR